MEQPGQASRGGRGGSFGAEPGRPSLRAAARGDLASAARRPAFASRARRFLPLAGLAAVLVVFLALGLQDWVDLDSLRRHRLWLTTQVHEHYFLSLAAFVLVYAAAVAVSVPGATALTVAGGFLFGQAVGAAATVAAATLGSVVLFLAARTALGDSLRARAGPWLGKLERGFAENALSYLLVLRLVPLFPFFVVNLVPAFLGVRLRTYFLGTLIGIIPGTVVYASIGAGLGALFAAGGDLGMSDVLTPEIIVALVGLALLALLPVAYKMVMRRRGA